MKFTIGGYQALIKKLHDNGYSFADYNDWDEYDKAVIMRHDIDLDLIKAAEFSDIERIGGVKSTYFVLLTSNFYNPFSEESVAALKRIMDNGCEIGLHFDEMRYPDYFGCEDAIRKKIKHEANILADLLNRTVNVVSMHRPSKTILNSNLIIPGLINSYGNKFFKDFKYISDSRRRWRDDIEGIIASGKYPYLHILAHSFWYNEEEIDIHDAIKDFVNSGNEARYGWLRSNITDLNSIMKESEIMKI